MLQIALAPAPVPADEIAERGRQLLIAAAEFGHQPHAPPGPAQKRRLDEIVAQDLAPERRRPRQGGQAGVRHERLGADDRVVAPVVAFVLEPVVQPCRQQRTVQTCRELEDACERGLAADRARHRLNQTRVGIGLHQLDQPHQGLAGHHAVRIEDHEVAVAGSPAAAEVGDVAGLAPAIVGAIAIEQATAGIELGTQPSPQRLFLAHQVLIPAVAQDEHVEQGQVPGLRQGSVSRCDAHSDLFGVLVIDGHHEGGARGGRQFPGRRPQARAAATAQRHEPGERRPERAGDPREAQEKDAENGGIQIGQPVAGQHAGEHIGRRPGAGHHQHQEQHAAR